ncbi:MAG: amidohydrolase family protein [Pirellulaceae bacterium]
MTDTPKIDAPLVDVNVHLSRWPARRLPGDETPELVERLRAADVVQAWVGSFDALIHRDIAGVNERLVEETRTHGDGMLIPFGAVNPRLPDWKEDLRRCHEQYKMPGVRLYPGYHGYTLADDAFAALLADAAERELIVQLAVKLEDERTQPTALRAATVDLAPLPKLLSSPAAPPMVLLNAMRTLSAAQACDLAEAGDVYFEIAMLEGVGGVERLLKEFPHERLLFGSHFPFFYLESALLKLRESSLPNFQRQALLHGNARRLLPVAS